MMQYRTDMSSPTSPKRTFHITVLSDLCAYKTSESQKTEFTVTRLTEVQVLDASRHPIGFTIDSYGMVDSVLTKMMDVFDPGTICYLTPPSHLVVKHSTPKLS